MGTKAKTKTPAKKPAAAKPEPAPAEPKIDLGPIKTALENLNGRLARLEQMTREHLGIDLAAYDAEQRKAVENYRKSAGLA